jgi:hypothetical protein
MSRIVMVMLIYHCHKAIDLIVTVFLFLSVVWAGMEMAHQNWVHTPDGQHITKRKIVTL